MTAPEMWTTVQSEVNRADSATLDAAVAMAKARKLQQEAAVAMAVAQQMTQRAKQRTERARALLKEHGPDHEIPYRGEL
jgi:hypothetical protein